jgi:tetratricopeptide (TPR) repeat protein
MSHPARARGLLAHPALHVLLVLVVAIIAYSNSIDFQFRFDDRANITGNPLIKDFRYFKDPSLADEVPMRYVLSFKNRVVGYLTLALNYRAHGLDVRGYRVTNIAIHIINALLVYWLVTLIFRTPPLRASALSDKSRLIALLSALLFVSHPVQTQAVTFVVQRLASLATLFCILSLTLYVRFRLSTGKGGALLYALSLFSAVLAMKTKEIAFTLPVIVALFELVFLSGPAKKRLLLLAPIALTMLIVPLSVLGSDASLGGILGDMSEATRLGETDIARSDYLLTEFGVIATYLRLLVFPINQNLDYDYPEYGSFFSPRVFLSFLLLVSIFSLGLFMLRRSRRTEPALRLPAFGIFWFFTTLSVESSIVPIVDVIFEHRLYLPSAGGFMAAGTAAFLLPGRLKEGMSRTAAFSLIALVVLLFSVATHARNTVWQSRLDLWTDVLKKSPRKARAHNNIAGAYESEGDMDRALKHYETAAMLKPDSVPIQNNLANAYVTSGMFEKAIERFSMVLRMNPDYIEAHHDLGSAYYKMGRTEKAIEQYERVIETNPKFMNAYINLGAIYNSKGRPDKAAEYLKQVVALRPDIAEAHYNLANSHAAMARFEEAIKEYSIALDLDPGNATAHYNIGNAYLTTGLFEKAIEHYGRAIRLKPDLASAHVNLGIAYKNTGRTDMAIEHYEKAVRLEPNNPDANYNLANAYMEQSMVEEAIPHYEKTVILRPEDPSAHNNLAIAYRQKGLEAEALKHISIAESLRQKGK